MNLVNCLGKRWTNANKLALTSTIASLSNTKRIKPVNSLPVALEHKLAKLEHKRNTVNGHFTRVFRLCGGVQRPMRRNQPVASLTNRSVLQPFRSMCFLSERFTRLTVWTPIPSVCVTLFALSVPIYPSTLLLARHAPSAKQAKWHRLLATTNVIYQRPEASIYPIKCATCRGSWWCPVTLPLLDLMPAA